MTRLLLLATVLGVLAGAGAAESPGAGSSPTGPERWLYCSQNLWVDANVDRLEALFRRAAKAGFTHVLLADSKFAKLGEMDARYFRNVNRLKSLAGELRLEIVPALFPVGYSNDLLWHDPNLVEALPVREALFVVRAGAARLVPEFPVTLQGGDLADLRQWDWKDDTVQVDGGSARITDPNGRNARISRKLRLTPFRQYHLTVRVRTEQFKGTPEVKLLAGDQALNFNSLGASASQDWKTHDVVFNSLSHTQANLYLGCWGGRTGTLQLNGVAIEEVGLVNLVRRPGAPLKVTTEDGRDLVEGRDFEPVTDPAMGRRLWKGSYDVYHPPPVLRTTLPDGTRLRVSYYHAVTVYDDQAMICPSEPATMELLRDQAVRMRAAWGARGYMMSHDEIRVLNWCDACRRRHLDAGAILADNVRQCIRILRDPAVGGPDVRIYVWSDMFDPHHNAHKNYYLVRGDLAGSWEGLDRGVTILNWNFDKRAESLAWFADRGQRQVMAGYYDAGPGQVRAWLETARGTQGVLGVMYTTWQNRYDDMESFAEIVRQFGSPGGSKKSD